MNVLNITALHLKMAKMVSFIYIYLATVFLKKVIGTSAARQDWSIRDGIYPPARNNHLKSRQNIFETMAYKTLDIR